MFKDIKKIGNLKVGDCITLTGYDDDAAEVEDISPLGLGFSVTLSSGSRKYYHQKDFDRNIRLYEI